MPPDPNAPQFDPATGERLTPAAAPAVAAEIATDASQHDAADQALVIGARDLLGEPAPLAIPAAEAARPEYIYPPDPLPPYWRRGYPRPLDANPPCRCLRCEWRWWAKPEGAQINARRPDGYPLRCPRCHAKSWDQLDARAAGPKMTSPAATRRINERRQQFVRRRLLALVKFLYRTNGDDLIQFMTPELRDFLRAELASLRASERIASKIGMPEAIADPSALPEEEFVAEEDAAPAPAPAEVPPGVVNRWGALPGPQPLPPQPMPALPREVAVREAMATVAEALAESPRPPAPSITLPVAPAPPAERPRVAASRIASAVPEPPSLDGLRTIDLPPEVYRGH